MPYIPQHQRKAINVAIDTLTDALVNTVLDDETANYEGMINYALTRLLKNVYGDSDNTRYSNINNAIGVLECCKLELYREVAATYENQKRHENGGVSPRDDSELLDTIVVNVQQKGGEGSGSGAPTEVELIGPGKNFKDKAPIKRLKKNKTKPEDDNIPVEVEDVADPRLSLKEQTEAESQALFNPPEIKIAPNPHTNAGYGETEFGDGEDL